MNNIDLDDVDHEILELLHEDGRASYERIGEEVDLSADCVRQRVNMMEENGVIKGFTVLTNPAELGYIPVAFGLSAEAGKTDDIAEELARHEYVYKVWVLSGRHNIIFHACFEDIADFQNFNHNTLHNIEGITSFESSIATRPLLEEGSIVLSRKWVD